MEGKDRVDDRLVRGVGAAYFYELIPPRVSSIKNDYPRETVTSHDARRNAFRKGSALNEAGIPSVVVNANLVVFYLSREAGARMNLEVSSAECL